MNWLPPENELDVQQREFLNSLFTNQDNLWIQGFPGSGKTVLLLYAAKRIKDSNSGAKILFIEFTHALIKMLEAAIDQLPYDDIHVVTYYDFVKNNHGEKVYDYVLCDEVQDVPGIVLERMKECSRRVIIAGDVNQSIYETDPQWNKKTCTPQEIQSLLQPRATSLNIIHRLTPRIIKAINSFLPEMNILAGRHPMIKKNVQIRLWKAENQFREAKYILDQANDAINVGDSVGILLKYHVQIVKFANMVLSNYGKVQWEEKKDDYGDIDFNALNNHLRDNGIPMQYIANGYGSFLENPHLITLTTYHSSKGLDFDSVFMPFCNEPTKPETFMTKTLFMVAMTRSRQNLYLSYTAFHMNHNLRCFSDQCATKVWAEQGQPTLFPISSTTSNNRSSSSSHDDDDIFG
jgi:superfamily I DNA/RNA helicase